MTVNFIVIGTNVTNAYNHGGIQSTGGTIKVVFTTTSSGTLTSTARYPGYYAFNNANSSTLTPSIASGITCTATLGGTSMAVASALSGAFTSRPLVLTLAASPSISYASPQTYLKGVAITALIPTSSGGGVVSYSVSPSLPAGLSLNTSTGVISGTPTSVSPCTTYTITATNACGNSTATVNITVNDPITIWDSGSWSLSTPTTNYNAIINDTYNGSGFTCSNLTVNAGKKASLSSGLVVNDTLTLISNDGGTAQLLNNGTVTNNGVIRIRKTFKPSYGWVFFSAPYDVPAANVKIAGTNTQATWGDITDTGVDFYVQEYDGALRDATGKAAVSNGLNWKNVSPKTFVKGKGYIIAVASDKTLDFISATGENSAFTSTGEIPVAKYTTNATVTHNSWNLIGQPFLSSFDLANATQDQAPFYYYDGTTYQTVMSGDSYTVSPFGAFFLQDHAATDVVDYAAAGKTLKKVAAESTFEEIPLTVSNDTYTDKTRVRLQAGSTSDYELGKDAVKMMSLNSAVPQIYTVTGGNDYSVNSLPSTTSTVNLVVTTGAAGTYTVSLPNIASASNYESILLVDGNNQTNLLEGNYTFTTNGALTKSMQLQLGTYTAINTASDTNLQVTCSGDKVTFSGLEGTANVQVYDVTGRLLQSFKTIENNQTVTLANKGVNLLEIVTTTGTTNIKVLVK